MTIPLSQPHFTAEMHKFDTSAEPLTAVDGEHRRVWQRKKSVTASTDVTDVSHISTNC